MTKDREKQISLWLPEDVLESIREDAQRQGITHQYGGQQMPSVARWIRLVIEERLRRAPGQ